jgi:alanine transaminase
MRAAMRMQLLESDKVGELFPSDVIARAKRYLAAIPGGTGAYSDSRGAMVLRQDIAKVADQSCSCGPPDLLLEVQVKSIRVQS